MLFEIAAGEAANEAGLFGRVPERPGFLRALAHEPMPNEPEALIAWARRHLADDPSD